MQPKIMRILETFVEKANRLRALQFEEHVKETGLGWRISSELDGTYAIEFDLPDDRDLDAFLFTLRLFIQQNEPISFHRLDRIIANESVSERLSSELSSIRSDYFAYLDGYPSHIRDLFGERPTRRQVLDVVMYGSLAHTRDNEKRAIYRQWTRDEVRANVLLQTFVAIVVAILFLIYRAADAINAELSHNLEAEIVAS